MTTPTKRDAIEAAMSIADDVAQGRLSPADLERQAVTELRELVGQVIGPDDPVWPLQVEIARGVLALDGIPATELSEWLAVARHRAGEQVSVPEPDQAPPEPEPVPSAALSPEGADPAPELAGADSVAEEQPAPPTPRRADVYDALEHWPPSRSLRRPL